MDIHVRLTPTTVCRLSWTAMTQSIDDAFVALGKNLKPLGIGLQATGLTTAAVPSKGRAR